MGQKAVLNSLRLKNNMLICSTSSYYIPLLQYFFHLKNTASKKGIMITRMNITIASNSILLFFDFFYTTRKIIWYKKRSRSLLKKITSNKKDIKLKSFFDEYLKNLRINKYILKIRALNRFANLTFSRFLYTKLRKFTSTLFSRRFYLWIDFLKATSLFCFAFLEAEILLKFFLNIFKVLPKRSHNRYLAFLKTYFRTLLDAKKIKGFKFLISGKLGGKLRSSSKYIKDGLLPSRIEEKPLIYAKNHVYTLLGTFGGKLWIYK